MPKVSIVIVSYNYARFLPDSVGSALGQTYNDLEVIIVNDGSVDDTLEVAYRLKDDHHGHTSITVIDRPNGGVSVARNTGVSAAKGEYILCLDADDMLAPEYLEKTVPVLDSEPGVSIIYTPLIMFGEDTSRWGDNPPAEEYDFRSLLTGNMVPNCCLYRKTAWEDAGGYKSIGFEDWELWIAMGEKGHFGRLVDEPLYLYRKHGPSRFEYLDRNRERLLLEMKLLHPGLYAPLATRLSPALGRASVTVKSYTTERVKHLAYRKLPGLHGRLRAAIKG